MYCNTSIPEIPQFYRSRAFWSSLRHSVDVWIPEAQKHHKTLKNLWCYI